MHRISSYWHTCCNFLVLSAVYLPVSFSHSFAGLWSKHCIASTLHDHSAATRHWTLNKFAIKRNLRVVVKFGLPIKQTRTLSVAVGVRSAGSRRLWRSWIRRLSQDCLIHRTINDCSVDKINIISVTNLGFVLIDSVKKYFHYIAHLNEILTKFRFFFLKEKFLSEGLYSRTS